jgi:hypothetical protein
MRKSTDELLAELRRLTGPEGGYIRDLERTAELFERLDAALSGGAPLPLDWRPVKVLVLV